MEFEEAIANAPPGWRHFTEDDIARLPHAVRAHTLATVPPGECGERLVRGLFWTLVYHLEPELWDALSRHEPIEPGLLDALPDSVDVAVDVGAGSGRLTQHLVARSRRTIAVEPSGGLRSILRDRLPTVQAVAGWGEALPLRDGCSGLTAACGVFGPDEILLAELRRVTARGGVVALLSPRDPATFERLGWRRLSVTPAAAPLRPRWIDEFFGPLDPPHELVMLRVG